MLITGDIVYKLRLLGPQVPILINMFFRMLPGRVQRIDNYFYVQQWWIRIVGMAQPQQRRNRVLYAVYRLFVLLIQAHITVLFMVTVYLDILGGNFKAVTYSLPQMVIMLISTFYLVYFQANADYYFDLMAYMNANIRFRSAKGKGDKLQNMLNKSVNFRN